MKTMAQTALMGKEKLQQGNTKCSYWQTLYDLPDLDSFDVPESSHCWKLLFLRHYTVKIQKIDTKFILLFLPTEFIFNEEVGTIVPKEDDGTHMVKYSKVKHWDSFFISASL